MSDTITQALRVIRRNNDELEAMILGGAAPGHMSMTTLEGPPVDCTRIYRGEHGQVFLCRQPPDTTCGEHRHMDSTEVIHVFQGSLALAGVSLKAGEAVELPRGCPHSPKAGPEGALFVASLCPVEGAYNVV